MNLIKHLEKIGFTRLEAQIYLALQGEPPMSAYQLAKKVEMSRPAIYNALEHMLEKGMVEVVPNETLLYTAQEPAVLLEKMQTEMQAGLSAAKKELEQYRQSKYQETTTNFKGFQTAIARAKEILRNAEQEVYINADFDLSCFKEELEMLQKKGIKTVIFSFYDIAVMPCKAEAESQKIETCLKGIESCSNGIDAYSQGIETYSHGRSIKDHAPSRFMLAADSEIALIADGSAAFESWKGTVSNNRLFVEIITEHIHNDIYLLKLKNKYGKEIYDDFLYLNTSFEQKRREEK